MKKLFLLLIGLLPVLAYGQTILATEVKDTQAQQNVAIDWLADLYEIGLEITEDSLKVSKEFQKVLSDANYRALLYPETYTWEQTLHLLQANELKKSFWFFINLYPENEMNKELVVKSSLAYDQVLKMDEVLVATFYTYIFLDPECAVITNEKPEVTRPDIMESKLASVREIVGYIYYYREQKAEKAP